MRLLIILLLITNICLARDFFVGGVGASDGGAGTAVQPYATIQKAASMAVSGDVVYVRSGTYRETVVPATGGVTFRADIAAFVTISGLNVADGGWSVHSGNIYKKSITLPNSAYNSTLSNNTTLLANQVFKDGIMQVEARWPNINSHEDYLHISTLRPKSQTVTFANDYIVDNSMPANITNGHVFILGWFIATTRQINSQSGTRINFSALQDANPQFREYYYVTHDLNLLDRTKEWHYENGWLYFWQDGGGAPTGVEYKVRNWGFDLRGKPNTQIIGLRFIGCDPVYSDTNTSGIVVDNIRAKFLNHNFQHTSPNSSLSFSSQQTGIKLIGPNCVIKNSELQYASGNAIWIGQNGRVENNLITDCAYDGNWGAAVTPWINTGGQVITRNTMYRLGRSAINLMTNSGSHTNIDAGYNDIHDFSMLNNDTGGIYSGVMTDHTGMRFHHNWVYRNLTPNPLNASGIQVGIYFDQASGPVTIDHNVCWSNGVADYYAEIKNQWRDCGGHKLYNNTFASVEPVRHSYVTYITTPNDVQRNNIYRNDIVVNWGASPGNIANAIYENVNPLFTNTGTSGLVYRLQPNSPAINNGIVISGITGTTNGNPDIGAYEFGGVDWVPGYVPVTVDPPDPPDPPDPTPEPSSVKSPIVIIQPK